MLNFKLFSMLIEAKIDDYKAQVSSINTSHDSDGEFKTPSDIIDHFHKHSPNGNLQHTRWMVDQYNKGNIKQEDAPDMKDTLTSFEKYKPQLQKKRIDQYKSQADLKTALHPFTSKDEEKKTVNQDTVKKGSTHLYSSPNLDVYHVHTMEAAQALGTDPKGNKLGWCTSHPDPNKNMFNHYNNASNKNFHIAHLHNEQFPYRRIGGIGAGSQFQDENNKEIKGDELNSLIKRNPELERVPAVTNSLPYRTATLPHRIAAAGHKNATKEQLDKAMNDEDPKVREAAIKNENATKEHLDKAMNDENPKVRAAAVAYHKNVTKEHLDKALNDEDPEVREAVAGHKNATKEHLDKAMNDKNLWVRRAAAEHDNATKEHLDKAMNDKDPKVRRAAVGHKNATKEHIDKARNDTDHWVRQVAENKRKSINPYLNN